MKYPLRPYDVVSQADIDAGRVYLRYHCVDYVYQINAAFYTGYIMALCKTKEEFDNLTTEDRAMCSMLAKLNAEKFYSEEAMA